ncbi:MAG: thioredoxin domain-containing protein, partial [Saprospiraceae bacterium]|nr:thioredoxin domain-containing protein [Saprospiraceae bacterium]
MSSQQNDHKHTNHLIHENSPYLLQHAHNPVNWYPWGEEALAKAKKEDKMILVSIGYAACHWCHVMEHESFEDTTVAEIMNNHFICIKVDREERPDIDDVYMTACQLASGRGCGWPLNSFALPDGRPVWAGTYFPKEQWIKVLDQFKTMWVSDRKKLDEYATQLTAGIQQQDQIVVGEPQAIKREDADVMAAAMLKQIDKKKGGRQGAPKFPMPNNYIYLLNYHAMTGSEDALQAVRTTIDAMADGGIYDQLGGGFARYSTDENWLVPHFEKMLYDNAQLLSLYAAAHQVTKDAKYERIITETVDWIDRELTDPTGGFYSSLDADSEGEEGKFYVWTSDEIDALLPAEAAPIYKAYYSIKEHGNWEETNILHRTESSDKLAERFNISTDQLQEIIRESNKTLLAVRNERVRPGLDDKILTSWNGLMISGLLDAYQSLQDSGLLNRAIKNAE